MPAVVRYDLRRSSAAVRRRPERAGTKALAPASPEDLLCRVCRTPVTTAGAALRRYGRWRHVCTNPAGITYTLHCYRVAPGCRPASAFFWEHTWFPGCAWQIVLCAQCALHLGWRFRGADDDFFGLIADRLVARDAPPQSLH